MNRRELLAGASALALASCAGGNGAVDALRLIHNLVLSLVNVADRLGAIAGLDPETIRQLKVYLFEAEGLLNSVLDTVSDDSKSAAEKILAIVDRVLGVLAPFAAAVPPFNIILPAARILIPVIARLFGIGVPAAQRALLSTEDKYPQLTEREAEEVLEQYAQ